MLKVDFWIIEVSIWNCEKTGSAGIPNLTYTCIIPPMQRCEVSSNPDYVYSTGDKRGDSIISRFLVSNQDVDVCRLPDNSSGGDFDFFVISDDNTLSWLLPQRSVDCGPVRVGCR